MACKVKISSDRPVAFLFICFAQTRDHSGFSQPHKISNIDIIVNFVLHSGDYLQFPTLSATHNVSKYETIDIIGCTPRDHATPLWTEFLTHASENITLSQTSFAGGNNRLAPLPQD